MSYQLLKKILEYIYNFFFIDSLELGAFLDSNLAKIAGPVAFLLYDLDG